MLLLHSPSWFTLQEVKPDDVSWKYRFEEFVMSDDCPMFVKAAMWKAQQLAEHPREDRYEDDDEEDEPDEAEQQPDWVDVYAGQNQRFEGVESEFQYDDGGEHYDWTSTTVQLPDGQDAKKWLEYSIEQADERNRGEEEVDLPDVNPLTLNEEQRSIASLVLHTLHRFIDTPDEYEPLRLIVSGTGGTGKSYVIKCLQRLVRQVFGTNDSIQVVTPTGNSAYLVQGSTVHRFLSLPTGGKSCNELTIPSGPVLERIQDRCRHLKVLIGDERSMFGRTTLGWMEQHARYGVNGGNSAEESWGGIPVVAMMGDDVYLQFVTLQYMYPMHVVPRLIMDD